MRIMMKVLKHSQVPKIEVNEFFDNVIVNDQEESN